MANLQKEKEWFDQLHKSQLEDLKVFMKPKYFNVFNGVIDKYSDSAHFIYELLQNADDAGATEVKMELLANKFIFTHNGRRRFTISNPATEEEDKKIGKLGDINSICSIGFSSKNFESEIKENKIGKFGVGFKAVFQYTSTPQIYDSPFCFKIDNFIVPTLLVDKTYQKGGKTVIVMPFNHKEISSGKAYEEISQKLNNLDYPQLFLHHIDTISWNTPEKSDKIEKILEKLGDNRDINYFLYTLKKKSGDRQRILLLKRTISIREQGKHEISIGYHIDHGRIATKTIRNIHCFFPTNENIGTCYEIHAPFALVDNRQQIKRNNEINTSLFEEIAQLAADSLIILRDWEGYDKNKLLNDNILHLIKYDTSSYDEDCYWNNKIENYFIESYKNIFEEECEPLFLSRNGVYLTKNEGWWSPEDIQRLFSDEQINDLTALSFENTNYEDEEDDSEESPYYGFILCTLTQRDIDESSIEIDKLTGEGIANKITSEFMQKQPLEWLNNFYDYVLRRRLVEEYEINKGNFSKAPMKYAKIMKNQEGNFIAAYNRNNKPQIFFYEEGLTSQQASINFDLYQNSGKFRDLIKELKIKIPSPLDSIRLQINRIQGNSSFLVSEINNIFISLIKFYNSCSREEQGNVLSLVKESKIFICDNNDSSDLILQIPKNIYNGLPILREYFRLYTTDDRQFLNDKKRYFFNKDSYKICIDAVGIEDFNHFINQLGLKDKPEIIIDSLYLTSEERKHRHNENVYKKEFPSLEGLISVLDNIEKGKGSKKLSLFIWDLLVETYKNDKNFFKNNISTYFYYRERIQEWTYNSLLIELRRCRWLFVNNELRSINKNAYKEDLIEQGYAYDPNFIKLLEIPSTPNIQEAQIISEMSEGTQETFALGKKLQEIGISSIDEVKQMQEELNRYKAKEESIVKVELEREEKAKIREKFIESKNDLPKRKESKELNGSDFDSPDNERAKSSNRTQTQNKKSIEDILNGFEEKAKIQKEELEKVASIRERIESALKYSYEWLTSLMELEVQSQGTSSVSGRKALYISFDAINFNQKDEQILILSEPSRYIPGVLEDIDSLPVTFVFNNGTNEKFSFDSVSVKNDTLILKCGLNNKKSVDLIRKNVNLISHAFIEVNEPIDILKNWQTTINGMGLEPEFSLKDFLRDDLEFIFGPPGTGKTTTLADKINGLIQEAKGEIKILVLAPTNKACDVLTRKLLERSVGADDWIWRFVKTDDSNIEEEELVYGRESQLGRQKKVCVISTIERYAFDGFNDGDLKSLEWDYVFIDEASMIPLYKILPPLFNQAIKKVIISGDPFQIEPIVNIDLWKGENIYTMVKLENFVNPKTEPFQFKVIPLMTQYRSIPSIGELFSGYLYGSKLSHHRKSSDHRILNLGVPENPLNVISFPVDRESIFDLKRLSGSNIQIYSVLFTVEFLKYLTKNLKKNHAGEPVKIGIISPYSAEIQAIQKIYNQSCIADDNIEVVFGSAHGFQGDQCDIIIAVINPPASGLKRAADMTFVNNKNILNVAISRASDYLFLLIPQKDYENFDSLYEIKKIGKKMNSLKCSFSTSDKIEKIMFGESHHIENNTFVTSHKMTNVFNNPFTKYEVRIDENAIDIQINDIV